MTTSLDDVAPIQKNKKNCRGYWKMYLKKPELATTSLHNLKDYLANFYGITPTEAATPHTILTAIFPVNIPRLYCTQDSLSSVILKFLSTASSSDKQKILRNTAYTRLMCSPHSSFNFHHHTWNFENCRSTTWRDFFCSSFHASNSPQKWMNNCSQCTHLFTYSLNHFILKMLTARIGKNHDF